MDGSIRRSALAASSPDERPAGDTIFALSSGSLPAAIAIIRISGPAAAAAAIQIGGPLPASRTMGLRTLRDEHGGELDQALVVHFRVPDTATGEELVELHCHGGRAVVAAILEVLGRLDGLREAELGEFTRRAVLNGRLDLTQAEGLGDLLAADTEWQRKAALASAQGSLSAEIERWRDRLVLLSAQAEAAIDYVDEAETEPDTRAFVTAAQALAAEWQTRLRQPRAELLQNGLRVVLAGPPNAGKSSLFNALAGSEKAIVTPVAGTTRDVIEARIDLGGIPITLVDTAGLRHSDNVVERIGVERAQAELGNADLLLWLDRVDDVPSGVPTIIVHARCDARADPAPAGAISTSVVSRAGVDELKQAISARAAALLPPPDRSALNRRQAGSLAAAASTLADLRSGDLLVLAEQLRSALAELDRLTGRQTTEDVLDALFSRFCLGK